MRSFKARTVLASVIGILAMLVAACGTSSSGNSSANNNAAYDFTYKYTTPKTSGGAIVFGEYEAVDTLNPLAASAEVDVKNINLILDGCLVQLPDLTLGDKGWKADQCAEVPTVANGDESADGLSTTVKLSPNAKWSDGKAITADDYLFYYNMVADPTFGGDPAPYNNITSVTRVDDNTFKIAWKTQFGPYLSALWAPFPAHDFPTAYDLTTHTYKGGIAAIANSDTFNFSYHGNGAYTLASHTANTFVYKKNPNFYSGFFHQPASDEIIFKSTGDVNTAIESFKTGQLDQVDDFIVTNIPSFSGIDPKQQVISPDISFEHMDFNQRDQALNAQKTENPSTTGHSIFANQQVRKAFIESLNLCVAFTAILDQDCHNPNLYTAENTAAPDPAFDPTVTLPKYDVAQAKADLKAAGFDNCNWSDGSKITLHIASTSGNLTRLNFISFAAQQWNLNLGCKFKVDTIPASTYFTDYASGGTLTTGAFDIALFAYIDGTECSLNMSAYESDQIPSATNPFGGNDSGVNDPQFDSLAKQALSTIDTAARDKICAQAQKELTTNLINIPLYIRANIGLVSPNLQNYLQNPGSAGNTWNAGDWWSTSPHAAQ